jgi:hypothetical protein
MWKKIFINLLTLIFISACSDSDDKDYPESVEILKPVLVEVNAGAAIATEHSALLDQTVTLDFHFLAPLDATLTNPRALTPPGTESAAPFSGLVAGAVTQTDYPGLRHFVVRAEGHIPSFDSFGDIRPTITANGYISMRYQLVVFDGVRDINIVGDFPAYIDRSRAESTANFADAAITKPSVDGAAAASASEIAATFTNPFPEDARIVWYATGETEIADRQARDTTLKLPGAGAYTLVFTVRARDSKAAAIRFRTITL